MRHESVEKNINLMMVLIVIVVSIGGLVEIVPLMLGKEVTTPAEGIEPYGAVRLAGRDVYIREGCYNCHSQQVRPFLSETERYGPYSVAGEFVYDRPFQFGSKRTGPDLARVGGRYSDEWHRLHFLNPRNLVPDSNMPAYPWLENASIDAKRVVRSMKAMRALGDPYEDAQITGAEAALEGVTELDALIAYLQGLGINRSFRDVAQN